MPVGGACSAAVRLSARWRERVGTSIWGLEGGVNLSQEGGDLVLQEKIQFDASAIPSETESGLEGHDVHFVTPCRRT